MLKKYVSEFSGAFLIVLFGCGAIVINDQYKGVITHLGISIAFGLIVCVAILIFKNYSAHFNPAVSITLFLNNQLSLTHAFLFCSFQIAGAITASVLLKLLFVHHIMLGSTQPSGSVMQSFVLEFILTFLLLALIYVLEKNPTKYAPLLIGFLIFLEAYFAGPICGASMNPARSIAPAIVSGNLQNLWVYIIAPILGGITAFFLLKRIAFINRAINGV